MWMVEALLAPHLALWRARQDAETMQIAMHWLALGGTSDGLVDARFSGLRVARHSCFWQGAYRRCSAALAEVPPRQPSTEDILAVCVEAEQRAWMGAFQPRTRPLSRAAKLGLTRLGGNFEGVFARPELIFGDCDLESAPSLPKKKVPRPLALTHAELHEKLQTAILASVKLQTSRIEALREALESLRAGEENDELHALHISGIERLSLSIATDEERRVAPGGADSVEFSPSKHIDVSYGEGAASALRFRTEYAAQSAELMTRKLFDRDGALVMPVGPSSSLDGNAAPFPLMAADVSGALKAFDCAGASTAHDVALDRKSVV
jgi:hypothetical protein